jgi:pyruvate/2-oxoglutarate/acetoin dehydrogenase E1 component
MRNYSKYHQAVTYWNMKLSEIPNSIFLGQQVNSEPFYNTLEDIPLHKRLEMPVAEEMQLGISIGLALGGYLPVSIYQRIDFIPRAFDQLVNHLNLIPQLSRNLFLPKVIIRTTIGVKGKIDVGLQHNKDLTEVIEKSVDFPVFLLSSVNEVNYAYNYAIKSTESIILIEKQDLYYDEEEK